MQKDFYIYYGLLKIYVTHQFFVYVYFSHGEYILFLFFLCNMDFIYIGARNKKD